MTQAASVYTGIAATVELASAGETKAFLSGTEGLAWKVTIASNNGLTISPTSGKFPTQLSIGATKNPGTAKRLASITVTIPDKNYSQVVAVSQYGTPPTGSTNGTIQLALVSTSKNLSWNDAVSYCDGLVSENFDDWRLPDDSEAGLLFGSFGANYGSVNTSSIWTARVNGNTAHRYSASAPGNKWSWTDKNGSYYVRCIRTVK